ncbi:Autoinducer 2-binding periplasmic protein LuxP [Vibrio stylophorae]|uniref:Autoinducer 2-binding periplasmic protein LuxP n=1 Tax=Vibrio stylophorae TaxID=659351 RepID=A0ABM8ZWZ0_9VIBR|nr:autoinducer 2-binding periplasmic protein LuxP [Vibrio stylophorae]CAH0535136.1 Autoinducer 2-binding periplasmic protein LuxP [Vibrio stylophorae]
MKAIGLALLVCCLSFQISAKESLKDYWELSEYLALHPEQVPLTETFAVTVQNDPVPLTQLPKKPISIAVIYPAEQISDYWRRNITAFEARLQALNIPYTLTPYYTKPATESREQTQYLLDALQSSPDYLIFTLDSLKHRKFIERVIGKGKPKLMLQNITTPVKAWQARQPFMYVGFDHATGSRMLANFFQSTEPTPLKYGVLYFTPGYISSARGDTFIDAMGNDELYQMQTAYYTKANRQSAYTAALSALKAYPKLDLLYACSTDIALGAIDALKELGLTHQVKVNGWGGGSAELDAIKAGEMDVTVMRMNDDTGVAMAEAIKADLSAQPTPLVYSGQFAIVTSQTPESQIERLKQRAFRYSDHPQLLATQSAAQVTNP